MRANNGSDSIRWVLTGMTAKVSKCGSCYGNVGPIREMWLLLENVAPNEFVLFNMSQW